MQISRCGCLGRSAMNSIPSWLEMFNGVEVRIAGRPVSLLPNSVDKSHSVWVNVVILEDRFQPQTVEICDSYWISSRYLSVSCLQWLRSLFSSEWDAAHNITLPPSKAGIRIPVILLLSIQQSLWKPPHLLLTLWPYDPESRLILEHTVRVTCSLSSAHFTNTSKNRCDR